MLRQASRHSGGGGADGTDDLAWSGAGLLTVRLSEKRRIRNDINVATCPPDAGRIGEDNF